MLENKIKSIVAGHFRKDMPENVQRLAAYAYADLHFGPAHNGLDPDAPFPGFEQACATVGVWVKENVPSVAWVDLDCGMVFDSEPQGYYDGDEWIEPFMQDTYHIERKQILAYIFGDLSEYL